MKESHDFRNNESTNNQLSSLIEVFVPPSAYSNQLTLVRIRSIIKALLFTSIIAAGFSSLYLFIKSSPQTLEIISFLGCALTPIFGAALIRFGVSFRGSLTATNILGVLFITAAAYFSGGVASPVSLWLLAIMSISATVGDRLTIITISGTIVLGLVLLFFIEELGFPPPPALSDYHYQFIYLYSITGAVILIGMGALISLKSRQRVRNNLARAVEAAEAASQAKSQFLSLMSHELRTPLNAILGFAQLLALNTRGSLNDLEKSNVNHILKGGEHLVKMVNDILDLTYIESDKMELHIEDISITSLLKESQSLMSAIAKERGIELLVLDDATEKNNARVDYDRLRQVLLNLLSNAVKYSRENGEVTISCKKTTDNMLRVAITDNGHGIHQDKLVDLFKPFNRLGDEENNIKGTGIGLVVCKDLIELMNGTIGVESQVDVGSTFWIEVPLANHRGSNTTAVSAA